jgi:hypothetical protein
MSNIFNDYYCFKRLADTKSKQRIDCVKSTQSHPAFEQMRNKQGDLFVYFGNIPENFNKSVQRRADKALTKTKSISSIFTPDFNSNLGFGDVKDTTDAIIIIFSSDYQQANNVPPQQVELFIARGQNNNVHNLYSQFLDGEFDEEIKNLRSQAKEEKVVSPYNKSKKLLKMVTV